MIAPTKAQVVAARLAAGLTQTKAAALVGASLRSWQDWESGDRRMHPGLWLLFLLRTDHHSELQVVARARTAVLPIEPNDKP